MRTDSKDLMVGLDIGTSKVVVAVAEMLPDSRFQVIGLGQARSEGLRKGVVVNIEATVQSIRRRAASPTSSPASPAATSRASIRAEWWRSRTAR
jgi:cell division protein FtsA